MHDPDFDRRLMRLTENLDAVATVLRDYGEDHWLEWVTRCRIELEAYDAAAFDHVLGAFGGMGSFNDLLILAHNGHRIEVEEEAAVNHRLSILGSSIWKDATALRHAVRASS